MGSEGGTKRPLFALQRSKDTPEKYQMGKEQKESGAPDVSVERHGEGEE